MKDYIKFSIIVPVYNTETYLNNCLNSLLAQTYENIEIIIINDGSTDGSSLICEEYEKRDERIVLINQKNSGLSNARNRGISESTGEYILFVDSDDYIQRDACDKFYKIIKKESNTDIIAANIINNKATMNIERYSFIENKTLFTGEEFLEFQLLNRTMYMSACRNVYSKKFLVDSNLYFKSGIYHEDEQWTPRVLLEAKKVYNSDLIFYNRVTREGSITKSDNKNKNAKDIINTVHELYDIFIKVEKEKLRKLLLDNLVTLYLHAFFIGKFYRVEYSSIIEKEFVSENAFRTANKIKAKMFNFSPKTYYFLNLLLKHTNKTFNSMRRKYD